MRWMVWFGILVASGVVRGGEPSWRSLFNGKDLNGWTVHVKGLERGLDPEKYVQVTDGMLHMYRETPGGAKAPFGIIVTEEEYADYHLRLQFKWGQKKFQPRLQAVRDAGVLYHVADEVVWPTSVECQIQEGDTGDLWTVRSLASTTVAPGLSVRTRSRVQPSPIYRPLARGGELFTVPDDAQYHRVVKGADHEIPGEWNTVEVIVRGDTATHLVNGHVVHECFDMRKPDGDGDDRTWEPLVRGRIALQFEWAEVYYRNVELRSLRPATAKEE